MLEMALKSLRVLGFLAATLGPGALLAQDAKQEEPTAKSADGAKKKFSRAVIIPIHGELTPMTESSFKRRLAEAKRKRADLIVVELDSPGGYVDTSVEIADLLLHVDWARTVAFVPREAMSGAAIVSLGCDDIL